MVSLFLLLGCNLSYIVDLFAALHELASASARTLLKLESSVRALLKPYGDTLRTVPTKYKGFCARLGPRGKSRSLQGLLESTKKNRGSHTFFRDN